MSIASDRELIEPRIQELVFRYVGGSDTKSVDAALQPVLEVVTKQAMDSSKGGKRLRALLTLQAFDAVAGSKITEHNTTPLNRNAVLDLACAVEVFQTAALVHDDIIDDSDLRRGKPSAHRALAHEVHDTSVGQGLGLMLGDILATACIQIVNAAIARTDIQGDINESFLTMQHEVEIGQVLDLGIEHMPLKNPESLAKASTNVFRWKTAGYTTIAPLLLAFEAAGLPNNTARAHALAIGEPLGIAFQLADDLIDVIGTSSSSGKPVGGDIREGKRNVLLADALAYANQVDRAFLEQAFESSARTENEVERVIGIYLSSGAVERSRERIRELQSQCSRAIGKMGLSEERARTLEEVCARFVPESLMQ